ncbi:MAG TPA: hypothetical protein PLN21_02525 [Gemmatales bacterium]|nr:hypothetical protein [Gemmatales bacterium]
MADDITLNTVLEHMSSMEQRLSGKITVLNDRVTEVHTGLSGQISDLGSEMRAMERRLLTQLDAIDERLDAIEIEKLPLRVTRLEKALRE